MPLALTVCAVAVFLLCVWLGVVSLKERERIAAGRSFLLALLVPGPFLALAWLPVPGGQSAGALLLGLTGGAVGLLLLPTGRPRGILSAQPVDRIDERTVMFSRAVLEPGSERFADYYRDYPEHRSQDDRWRALPGLMSPESHQYEPLAFAAAAASFDAVEKLATLVEAPAASARVALDSDVVSRFLAGWAKKLGAVACGVTVLRDYHLYAVKGRGQNYGQSIDLHETGGHRFAIALAVEMDHANLGTAPAGPTLMESAQQYLDSGAIAVQIAAFIRRLGYNAEAHIDANYQVVCPLVARDAGLGEIGRMGLLMTPRLGPRVRLGVVTTDLPLNTTARNFDPTVEHFCARCRKCADICPPRAIPAGPPAGDGSLKRWQIDQEACFAYWCVAGTDCGQCVRVCPYSHPDSTLHNLVRWGLKRSWLFRHFALRMDDFLYGRRPGPLPHPAWLPRR